MSCAQASPLTRLPAVRAQARARNVTLESPSVSLLQTLASPARCARLGAPRQRRLRCSVDRAKKSEASLHGGMSAAGLTHSGALLAARLCPHIRVSHGGSQHAAILCAGASPVMITGASAFQNSRWKRARDSAAAAQRGIARAASTPGSSGGGSSGSTASGWAPSSLLELQLRRARASAPASTCQSKQRFGYSPHTLNPNAQPQHWPRKVVD